MTPTGGIRTRMIGCTSITFVLVPLMSLMLPGAHTGWWYLMISFGTNAVLIVGAVVLFSRVTDVAGQSVIVQC